MQYLFFAAVVISLFIFLLIILKKKSTYQDLLPGGIFLISSIHALVFFLIQIENEVKWIFQLSESLLFVDGLFFWLFTIYILGINIENSPSNYWKHFGPFVIFYTLTMTTNWPAVIQINRYLGLASTVIYLILCLQLFKKKRNHIYEYFSSPKYKKFMWLKYSIYLFLLALIINILSQYLYSTTTINIPQYGNLMANLVITLVIFIVSFNFITSGFIFSIKQLTELKSTNTELQVEDRKDWDAGNKDEIVDIEKLRDYFTIIEGVMVNQKPYLNTELTMPEMASIASIPQNDFSNAINTIAGVNFYEYVNKYRIVEIKNAISQNMHLKKTLIAIAMECGFASKSTFNRAFKKMKGITPSEYIKNKP